MDIESQEEGIEQGASVFEWKQFKVVVLDKYNLGLYRLGQKEVFERREGGGKGRGKSTGQFVEAYIFEGFFPSFKNAIEKMLDLALSYSHDISEMKEILKEWKELLQTVPQKTVQKIYLEIKSRYGSEQPEEEKEKQPVASKSVSTTSASPMKRGRGRPKKKV